MFCEYFHSTVYKVTFGQGHLPKMMNLQNDDDWQDHMCRFSQLKLEVKGQICNIWRAFNTKRVARYHQVVDRQKRACSFCAVIEPCTEMSPRLAVISEILHHVILTKKPYGRRLRGAALVLYVILVCKPRKLSPRYSLST